MFVWHLQIYSGCHLGGSKASRRVSRRCGDSGIHSRVNGMARRRVKSGSARQGKRPKPYGDGRSLGLADIQVRARHGTPPLVYDAQP